MAIFILSSDQINVCRSEQSKMLLKVKQMHSVLFVISLTAVHNFLSSSTKVGIF